MNKIFALLLMSVFSLHAYADSANFAMAKRRAAKYFSATELIKHFKAKINPTAENKKVLALTRVGSEVMAIENFEVPFDLEIDQVSPSAIVSNFSEAIRTQPWKAPLANGARQLLIENRGLLQQSFAETSYEWAWILNHLGETKKAGEKLSVLYDQEYARIMKLQAVYDGNSLLLAQALHQALLEVAPAKDHGAIKEKMRKMKAHVSSLPNHQMMT